MLGSSLSFLVGTYYYDRPHKFTLLMGMFHKLFINFYKADKSGTARIPQSYLKILIGSLFLENFEET